MSIRHPLAAVLGVAGLVVATVAALGTPASAADDELSGTVTFSCEMATFNATYDWEATVALSAVRPAGSTTVTVTAETSDMDGVSPAPLDYDVTNKLELKLAGQTVTLTGSGHVTAGGNEAFPLPATQGTFQSSADDVTAEVTGYEFTIDFGGGITGVCTPTGGAALGTLTLAEGTPPVITPSVTPTTTTSATATPTTSASPSASSSAGAGKPAKGTVPFACALNIGSEFDWKPTVKVSGYREKASDPVSLVATMSDLPGISPVPILGTMDFTLDITVGGEKTQLTSSGQIDAAPDSAVPVTDLSGTVDVEGDELEVTVSGFTFDFPSGGVGAECTADDVAMDNPMTVGTEPVAVATPTADGTDGTGGTGSAGGGTLPQTGGGDSLPVVALWALALTLLGVAGLLCVPQARRQH